MKDKKETPFLKFLTTNEPRFRLVVFYLPLLVAAIGMIWYLLRGRYLAEALSFAAFMFLLACFIGIVSEIFRRKNQR